MEDNQNGQGGAGSNTPDPIANVKGEFNRKIGNLEQQITSMAEANKQLLAQIQSMNKPQGGAAPVAQDEDALIEKEWFDNPAKAASLLTQKVTKTVRKELDNTLTENSRRQSMIGQLVSDFPELSNENHAFTKRAVEIYNSLPAEERSSPIAYKAAVNQAALEQGVAPKSKRQQNDDDDSGSDDFSLNGSGSSEVRRDRNRNRKGGISQAQADFARLMGVNIDDDKVKERIKNNHGRRGYRNYE
jgi:hypothetical protein